MKAQVKLGRIAGISIGLHYSWFIIALLIALSLAQFGYFISRGKQFRMASAQPELERDTPDWEALLRRYGIRDESVCPDAKTMFDYARGMRRAVAIVEAWKRNHRGLGMKVLDTRPTARTSFSGPVEAWQP